MFAFLFLKNNKRLQHIEVSDGFKPRLLKDREHVEDDVEVARNEINQDANIAFATSRRLILRHLLMYANKSLISFTEYDELTGPFMEDQRWWKGGTGLFLGPRRFEKVKLVAFRCRDLRSLTAFDGIDDCTAGYKLRHRDDVMCEERQERQRHSLWIHV
jgi:hypothetical protein